MFRRRRMLRTWRRALRNACHNTRHRHRSRSRTPDRARKRCRGQHRPACRARRPRVLILGPSRCSPCRCRPAMARAASHCWRQMHPRWGQTRAGHRQTGVSCPYKPSPTGGTQRPAPIDPVPIDPPRSSPFPPISAAARTAPYRRQRCRWNREFVRSPSASVGALLYLLLATPALENRREARPIAIVGPAARAAKGRLHDAVPSRCALVVTCCRGARGRARPPLAPFATISTARIEHLLRIWQLLENWS
jgi:hypothetical protein